MMCLEWPFTTTFSKNEARFEGPFFMGVDKMKKAHCTFGSPIEAPEEVFVMNCEVIFVYIGKI